MHDARRAAHASERGGRAGGSRAACTHARAPCTRALPAKLLAGALVGGCQGGVQPQFLALVASRHYASWIPKGGY